MAYVHIRYIHGESGAKPHESLTAFFTLPSGRRTVSGALPGGARFQIPL